MIRREREKFQRNEIKEEEKFEREKARKQEQKNQTDRQTDRYIANPDSDEVAF